ncbi:MAG: thiamine phosphate synthase [Cystobacterineae bacterium]|nr:thiamine phosphate synthase [Cystobacterineae bacterium]
MKFKLLAISPGPLDNAWFPQLTQLLHLGDKLGFLYRDTSSNTRSYFEQAQQLAKLCHTSHVAFFVHRRLDIALALHAHLHLPSYGLSPRQARLMLPQNQLISVSVHNEEEASQAQGANFALLSPVFPPNSKPEDTRAPLGPHGFLQLAKQLPCPAWALGGITLERLLQLKPLPQLAGIAAISALWQNHNPLQAAQALLAHL